MAITLPGASKHAKVIARAGRGFAATFPGIRGALDMEGPAGGMIGPGTQYDPGDGSPMIGLVQAYLNRALPPKLLNLIDQLVMKYLQLQNVHDYAASTQSLNDLTGASSPPPQILPDLGGGAQPLPFPLLAEQGGAPPGNGVGAPLPGVAPPSMPQAA